MGIPVPNYPMYLVEKSGLIYSKISNRYLKPAISQNGYLSVELFNEFGSKRHLVHRLVATAYLENPCNYPQVNHKDEDKTNNSVDNLEWCSPKYNMNYGRMAKIRHELIDYSTENRKDIARKNGMSVCKKVSQFDNNLNCIAIYNSIKEAYQETKILHISECCKSRRKTAGGYIWKYTEEE